MIKLNFGTRTYPLSQEEAVYVAESLLSAAGGKAATLPAFNSSRHGHISVFAEKPESAKGSESAQSENFRSNPPQSDHVLTDC
ncbi:hypothetical protein D0N50_05305 [Erwinia billingiae]|uniref:hypothetical protein n=1 Tax=Erwinia billingiae TaxID=182337 RepID=UPI001244D237|nr:hypothetical protein [Erwinia billingiae]QEW31125.1 hypothetical protein D0N50_05305 [Erwinia billingiae]